jgi:hypothetical protein
MDIAVQILKILGDITLVESSVTVDETVVPRGKRGFARRTLPPPPVATADGCLKRIR